MQPEHMQSQHASAFFNMRRWRGDTMKTCTTCKCQFDISFFNKDKQKKDGLNPRCRDCSHAWNKKNKDRVKEYNKKYYAENTEYNLNRAKEYRKENRDLLNQKKKDWYSDNKNHAYQYRKERALIYGAHARNRRARILNNGGTHTSSDVLLILSKQQGKCAICKAMVGKYHVDHIYPLASGGRNSPDNLQILCAPCNLSKNRSDPIDYMQARGFLI